MSDVDSVNDVLAKFEVLAEFAPDEREELGAVLELRELGGGQLVFQADDDSSEMYFVVDGCVTVRGPNQTSGDLGPGEVLGALSPVVIGCRECDARATENSIVLVLSREAYQRLGQESPALALKLQEGILRSVSTLVRAALLDRRAG